MWLLHFVEQKESRGHFLLKRRLRPLFDQMLFGCSQTLEIKWSAFTSPCQSKVTSHLAEGHVDPKVLPKFFGFWFSIYPRDLKYVKIAVWKSVNCCQLVEGAAITYFQFDIIWFYMLWGIQNQLLLGQQFPQHDVWHKHESSGAIKLPFFPT
jgi:hypothetical protein